MRTRSFPVHLLRLLMDPRVSRQKKLAFPLIVFAYWLLPDVLPFIPLDDVLFTALMTYWFANSAEKDTGRDSAGREGRSKGGGKYVDVEGTVVDNPEE